jgi:DNA-binding NarL/FixJ family response regulator
MAEAASTILILEDDWTLRELLRAQLQGIPGSPPCPLSHDRPRRCPVAEVICVPTASLEEAIEAQVEPDACIIDLGLPDSQGLHTLLEMMARYPRAAIIVLSGETNGTLIRAAYRFGIQRFLSKGESTGNLRAVVAAACAAKQGELDRLEAVLEAAPEADLTALDDAIAKLRATCADTKS